MASLNWTGQNFFTNFFEGSKKVSQHEKTPKQMQKLLKKEFHMVEHEMVSSAAMVP